MQDKDEKQEEYNIFGKILMALAMFIQKFQAIYLYITHKTWVIGLYMVVAGAFLLAASYLMYYYAVYMAPASGLH